MDFSKNDNLYRLTNETVALDPGGINGAVNYTSDPVGNRKQMASTLPGVAAGLWDYDANDRFTAGDTYDANGGNRVVRVIITITLWRSGGIAGTNAEIRG
jgi:hypothetical protein